jgi:transcriptional regulator with XRE-family HTH domain
MATSTRSRAAAGDAGFNRTIPAAPFQYASMGVHKTRRYCSSSRLRPRRDMRPIYFPVTLTCPKPIPSYPLQLRIVGDHVKRRRLDRGLTQSLAASELGVSESTIVDWERGKYPASVRCYPAIIAFLGYNPLPEPRSRGQAIRRARLSRGLSRKRLAAIVGVDEATVARNEADVPRPARKPSTAILRALGLTD